MNVCDVRISWALAGCRDRWPSEVRSVATSLPADYVGMAAGRTARALVFEIEMARQFRAKAAFTNGDR